MTDLNLDHLEELAKRATRGPWRPGDVYPLVAPSKIDGISFPVARETDVAQREADAEFIAEMRNATPALLARVRELEATVERVREAMSGHPKCDIYDDDDVISCGWKNAYASVARALEAIGGDDA